MPRPTTWVAAVVILGLGLLRVLPAGAAPPWFQLGAWIVLAALVAHSIVPREATRWGHWVVIAAFSTAALLMIRFGRYECWPIFQTLCGAPVQAGPTGWTVVFVNQDTFTYVSPFSADSIRPPLYYWFSRLFSFASWHQLVAEARNLIPFETNAAGAAAYLTGNPQPALLRLAQAQQFLLWAAVIFFLWAAARVVPVLGVAALALALYDGGVLTHWYFAHVIESKFLYLACLFSAAAATLLVMWKPTWRTLLLAAVLCAALPLARPQGMTAAILVAVCCARFVTAQRKVSAVSVGTIAIALLLFGMAAALPAIASFARHGIVQPTNIYALSKIPFALELAGEDDVGHMPDAFTERYLAAMLTARDARPKANDINRSLMRNQAIAIQACDKVGEQQRLRLSCAEGMNKVANAVLGRHFGEYSRRIVLPAMRSLGQQHVGGSIHGLPVSVLACFALIGLLVFKTPWLALWGGAILVMQATLVALLATLAGPFSYYLITTEPVFLSALAIMVLAGLRGGIAEWVKSATVGASALASPKAPEPAG